MDWTGPMLSALLQFELLLDALSLGMAWTGDSMPDTLPDAPAGFSTMAGGLLGDSAAGAVWAWARPMVPTRAEAMPMCQSLVFMVLLLVKCVDRPFAGCLLPRQAVCPPHGQPYPRRMDSSTSSAKGVDR